jgi:hypothetical protein
MMWMKLIFIPDKMTDGTPSTAKNLSQTVQKSRNGNMPGEICTDF